MNDEQLDLVHRAWKAAAYELEHSYSEYADRLIEARLAYEKGKKSADEQMRLHRKDIEAQFLTNIKEGGG